MYGIILVLGWNAFYELLLVAVRVLTITSEVKNINNTCKLFKWITKKWSNYHK